MNEYLADWLSFNVDNIDALRWMEKNNPEFENGIAPNGWGFCNGWLCSVDNCGIIGFGDVSLYIDNKVEIENCLTTKE